jgi:hypothetical protein
MSLWSFNKIREALEDIENRKAYYLGGSLCIDFEFHPNVVLNRSGRGFFYGFKSTKHKEIKFVMPNDIKDKVLDIYTKYKIVPVHEEVKATGNLEEFKNANA